MLLSDIYTPGISISIRGRQHGMISIPNITRTPVQNLPYDFNEGIYEQIKPQVCTTGRNYALLL